MGIFLGSCIAAAMAVVQFMGWAAFFEPWVLASPDRQAYGSLRQRNQLSTLAVLGFVSICYLLQSQRPSANATIKSVAYAGALTLLAFSVAFSESRTGLIQWLVVAVAVWMAKPNMPYGARKWAAFSMAIYTLAVCLTPWLAAWSGNTSGGLLGRIDDANALSRISLWSNVAQLIAQQPWLGHGWRSLAYAHYSSDFSGARFMEMLDNAHNLPLHLAVELGVPVALAFCAVITWLVWRNQPWKELQPDRQLAWAILLVLAIHSLVEYPLWYGPFFMTAVICIGVLCAPLWRNRLLAQAKSARSAMYLGATCIAISLLSGTAYVAFDYHRVSQIFLQSEQRSAWFSHDALAEAQKSALFGSHAKFAELVITPLSRETAPRVLELSSELVKWSPEPRVVEKLIESAVMMQLDELAMFHIQRYKVAYPQAYAAWSKRAS